MKSFQNVNHINLYINYPLSHQIHLLLLYASMMLNHHLQIYFLMHQLINTSQPNTMFVILDAFNLSINLHTYVIYQNFIKS